MKFLLRALAFLLLCYGIQQSYASFLNPEDRPEDLKKAIQATFETLPSDWRYNGGASSQGILFIDEFQVLMNLLSKGRKEVYIMNIGSGTFEWAKYGAKIINQSLEEAGLQDVIVNIISLTGDRLSTMDETQEHKVGRCVLYNLDRFPIEDLHQALSNRNLDFRSKLDVIVSKSCFDHLNDPLGTLVQAYDLLRPETGVMMCDQMIIKDEKLQPISTGEILMLADCPFIVAVNDQCDFGSCRFILQKGSTPLNFPLSYSGTSYYETMLSRTTKLHPLFSSSKSDHAYYTDLLRKAIEQGSEFLGHDTVLQSLLEIDGLFSQLNHSIFSIKTGEKISFSPKQIIRTKQEKLKK